MNIVCENKNKITFKDIGICDVFKYNDEYFFKIKEVEFTIDIETKSKFFANAISLSSGECRIFLDSDIVHQVNATLNVSN